MADENKPNVTEEEENNQNTSEEENSQGTEETSREEEETEEESSGSDEWDEDDLATAKELYRALKNPNSAKSVIGNLAKQVGLEFGTGSNKGKAPEKTVEHPDTGKNVTIKSLVEEKLPPNMRALAPAIIGVLEHVNKEYFEKQTQETSQSLHNQRSDSAVSYLQAKYNDYDEYEPVMEKLARKIAPTALSTQTDYNEYAETLYVLAKQQAGDDFKLNKRLSKILDKQEKNKSRAKPSPSDTSSELKSVSAKSVADAIRLAEEQMRKAK